ncbi:NUDIX hydrolase [Enterococcus casseliflavus]|uniref:NUDIX hydrolase n=1 Tax=Enterococcus casseliflavus TaxID=37734 RepID=UPI002542C987|nr:NUDIX hydrolase [Enterococcus casseliflavus]MDK4449800.1 NUDIX hydrolase [Enterococcus casseliflavus]
MYHTAFGVYGILFQGNCLAVIKKKAGPHQNRYDLPGGSMEAGELLEDTLCREFKEETGMTVTSYHQLGTINFLYPWRYKETTMNNHICVFFQIEETAGTPILHAPQFDGQDSLGCVFLPQEQFHAANASPLVLKACEYGRKKQFIEKGQRITEWSVLSKPHVHESL